MINSILHMFIGPQPFEGIAIAPHTEDGSLPGILSPASLKGEGVEGEPQSFSSVLEKVAQFLPKTQTFLQGLETPPQADQLLPQHSGRSLHDLLRQAFLAPPLPQENGTQGRAERGGVIVENSEARPFSDSLPIDALREILLALHNQPNSSTVRSNLHQELDRLSEDHPLRETLLAFHNQPNSSTVRSNLHQELNRLSENHALREALLAIRNQPSSSTVRSDLHQELNRLSENHALKETVPAPTNSQSDPLVPSDVHEGLNVLSQSNASINRLLQSILGSLNSEKPHVNPSPVPDATLPTLTSIPQVGSSSVLQKQEVVPPQRVITAPVSEPSNLLVKVPQGISDTEKDTGTPVQSPQRPGTNHDLKVDRLIRDVSLPYIHQHAQQGPRRETLGQLPGVVDPGVVKNSTSALSTAVHAVGSSERPEFRLLDTGGLSNPTIGEKVQGRIHVEGGGRSAITTAGPLQSATGELGSSSGETLLGQHTNSGFASSSDSHHGHSSTMNQAQSSLRANVFEERFQSYQPTLPQRLQIDVQLSEHSRVQVDVAVQQRQVYAALLMDQPILRNLALQHAPQLEGQLHQIGMELQDLDVEVDHQSQSQNKSFERDAQSPRPVGTFEQGVNDRGKAGEDVESGQEQGVHVVV